MSLQEDLSSIAAEYKSYFPELSIAKKEHSSLISHISLRTLEGQSLALTVSEQGWYLLGSNRYYDTFETLMNTQSRGFRESFAKNLFEKLQNLAG